MTAQAKKIETNILPLWFGRYLGIKYKAAGRDRAGLDNYGLVRLIHAEQFGTMLGRWTETRNKREETDSKGAVFDLDMGVQLGYFRWLGESEELEIGDIIVFTDRHDGYNFGLALNNTRMLQVVMNGKVSLFKHTEARDKIYKVLRVGVKYIL